MTYKATTFNGNVVIGKGATLKEAKADAQNEASKIGSCIRKGETTPKHKWVRIEGLK